MHRRARKRHVATPQRLLRPLTAIGAAAVVAAMLVGVPAVGGSAPAAFAAGAVYIDEPLQGEAPLSGWSLQGEGNVSKPEGVKGYVPGDPWVPTLSTVAENNQVIHSNFTNECGIGGTNAYPLCRAQYNANRDSKWLTLTTDNTNANGDNSNGGAQSGTALHNTEFASDLGVILEYDQRVYRTNDGRMGGDPEHQGGGDGIAVYLADAAPPNYGDSGIDNTVGEAGGPGAGLGYSAVAASGTGWCAAQQGVPGGYLGVGFDVYGNYQKAEKDGTLAPLNRATRPYSIASGNDLAYSGVANDVKASRIPQSIGLRGSGVRYTSPSCDATTTEGMRAAYGMVGRPIVTNAGMHTVFQVKWNQGDTAAQYAGEYQAGGTGAWTAVPAQEVPTALLPAGFSDSRGYVMFTVPSTVPSFSFRYTKAGNATTGTFAGIGRDVSLGNAPAYTTLSSGMTGGYRWLAGTGNLSTYPNPTDGSRIAANDAARFGAVIDNTAGDATHYRRVRVTLTPAADGAREVKVFWSDKLDVADDRCYTDAGIEITGVSTAGGVDACVNAGGTWQHAGGYAFEEKFSYNLAASSYQADLPSRFRLGFSASTGWAVNYHQIRNLRVTSVLDLAVEKKVQALGDATTIDGGAWADAATTRGGENVAYRVNVWNNGLSDLDPDYPATVVDGLDQVPFADAESVSWTATATGDAQICTAWSSASAECTSWATSLTGTGPLSASAPLRWTSAARTADPTAGVSMVFRGEIGEASAPGTYPNTAEVGVSNVGGPQEDDLTNNTDTAQITLLPAWSLGKSASPGTGSVVHAGDTITYTVAASALSPGAAGDIADTTIVDSLAEVADYADFDAGSVLIDGAAPGGSVTVTEPSSANDYTLTVAGLDLAGGDTAEVTYTVTVKTPVSPNASFRNYVVGEKSGNPPVQCADADEDDYLANCSTEHLTPALLQVLKVGENTAGDTVPFEGSEWAVFADDSGSPGASPIVELTDETVTGLFRTPLDPGVYWLQETKALDGFSLLPAPVRFTVAADGGVTLADGDSAVVAACAAADDDALCALIPAAYDDAPTIVVLDVPVLDLPEAGGSIPGWTFFAIGALVLALTGAVTAVLIVRRRRADAAEPIESLQ